MAKQFQSYITCASIQSRIKINHLLTNLANLNSNKIAPAITKINAQDAAAFVNALNLKSSIFQYPNSMWNTQFPSYTSPDVELTVAATLAFQRSNVTLTYDNCKE
jgi:hypothetical protein